MLYCGRGVELGLTTHAGVLPILGGGMIWVGRNVAVAVGDETQIQIVAGLVRLYAANVPSG
jgi:hypothetical protein